MKNINVLVNLCLSIFLVLKNAIIYLFLSKRIDLETLSKEEQQQFITEYKHWLNDETNLSLYPKYPYYKVYLNNVIIESDSIINYVSLKEFKWE